MAGNLTAMIASIFSGGVTADPYFEYTTLLLPGNGTNGKNNNEFLDSSTNNFTITRNPLTGPNAPTQGTFSPFSQTGWGNYFDGTGDYLACGSNAAYQFGTGDFTIEFWQFTSGYNGVGAKIFQYATDGNFSGGGYGAEMNSLTNLTFYTAGAAATLTATLAANQWNHVAIVRSSATTKIYVNGSSVSSAADSSNYSYTGTYPFAIGSGRNGAGNFNSGYTGYLSSFRVVKGTAVYTGNFTPPTAPLTAITNTQLLTCQSNRFLDTSTNNFTITPNGDSRVVAFSPFNPTSSWSAATNGGSGYFDGSGDYLSVASNAAFAFGTGDFTIEFWLYPTSTSQRNVSFATPNAPIVYMNGSRQLELQNYGVASIATTTNTLDLNAWNHCVATRQSGTLKLFINGVQGASVANSTNWVQSAVNVGTDAGSNYCNGYMTDVRILKGTGYSTITFPTAPLTAITNTSLLLNFTNAGVYDATSKNDLETVGNASISNTTAQFGATSITFNGTTGYMTAPASSLFNFGTGDFTIEAWVYASSLATRVIFSNSSGSGTNNITFYITSNGKINANNFGVAPISSIDSITAGTWNYVAIIKSSGVYTFYINGSISGVYAGLGSSNNLTDGYCTVGARPGPSDLWSGYIQDLRITKGYARNIAASPTAAFPTL